LRQWNLTRSGSVPVYEVLQKIAFEKRVKIHDLALEGTDERLSRRRRYPSVESLGIGRTR